MREEITLFVEKTSLVKRQDSIISTVEAREVDSAEKQQRLLSTKYGTVQLDQIMAKAPKVCLNDIKLKLLTEQLKQNKAENDKLTEKVK